MPKSLPSRLEGERIRTEVIDRPRLREVLDYWNLLRGDKPMPPREAFNPIEVKRSLGLISIADVVAGQPVELEFWHGHGGRSHLFTLLPTHYEALKRLERVTIVTTEVDSHQHELFIDPVDPRYRAAGAQPIRVLTC